MAEESRDVSTPSSRARSRGTVRLGVALVSVGLLLLVGVLAYYGYRLRARTDLEELEFSIQEAVAEPSSKPEGIARSAPAAVPAESPEPKVDKKATVSTGLEYQPQVQTGAFSVLWESAINPVVRTHPKYWGEPQWAGIDPYPVRDRGLPEGYRPASAFDFTPSSDATARAQRIRIPTIGVDSAVAELRILDLGDSGAYETPKNVVGHIPETVNPGQLGNGWFFGHLESPVRGEGSVFRKLPEISKYVRDGDRVYVAVQTEQSEYLYMVTSGQVVHQDDLRLYDSEEATITLVTCVPRLVYDHRFLVTAQLVGVKN